jgi:hypothetical protein
MGKSDEDGGRGVIRVWRLQRSGRGRRDASPCGSIVNVSQHDGATSEQEYAH